MGDEVGRTQQGNNNAYCHDDPSTWFDCSLLDKHADVHRFVGLLNARRSLRDVEHELQRVSLNKFLREANKAWHGVKLHEPDWGDGSHSIALGAELRGNQPEQLQSCGATRQSLRGGFPGASR
jgi:isoamylase